jgi:hypothetical protein
VQLHYDNLQALLGEAEVPSYVTLRRYMASQGLYKQRRVEAAKQFAPREVRFYERTAGPGALSSGTEV